MLQVASLYGRQCANWQTTFEAIHRRNLWDVQCVVGYLQTDQSFLTTAYVRLAQNVSYKHSYT
jgi:hypothetical protein